MALDIATNLGFCMGPEVGKAPRFGTLELPGVHSDDLIDRSEVAIYDWLFPVVRMVGAKIVVIEAPFIHPQRDEHNNAAAFFLVGAARVAGRKAGAKVVLQRVQTVRACFIGNGNLKRDEAKALVFSRCVQLGWAPKNHDEADAGALWYWAMATTYPKWNPK